jgi:hypothetical protein
MTGETALSADLRAEVEEACAMPSSVESVREAPVAASLTKAPLPVVLEEISPTSAALVLPALVVQVSATPSSAASVTAAPAAASVTKARLVEEEAVSVLLEAGVECAMPISAVRVFLSTVI